ncbi:hypothetical protein [Candidatus Cetobacterium colombiensis]|uniref:ACB domain-containing protein n=1 Tax=Candidatus Cetobacterium colombiensis TaxID=3073100 RepID=A0ABU4WBW3_9FUSO|nr:hypothetical protein [Candidatus Cetobacterium colombiensis]MDX8337006.1 hypothetical protein [Candidatus Cetobacterium colombiensis]
MVDYIEKIKKLCPELDEIGIGAVNKYISDQELNEIEESFLFNLRKINIEQQKEKISQIDIEAIDTYISFFSLANIGKYEYSILEKNLQIFENIKNIYFLATPQSIEKCKAEISKMKILSNDINIEVIDINPNDYEGVYTLLLKEITNNDIENKNILIDNTLGPKMVGYSLYKFSIDQGTKLITWQSQNIKDSTKRVPGSDTLNYIEFPQLKNSIIINKINKFLESYKFQEAAELASSINNIEEADIFQKLGDLFSIDSLTSYDSFLSSIENFIDSINSTKYRKSLKTKLSPFIKELKNFLESDDKKIKYINFLSLLFDYFREKFDDNPIFKIIVCDILKSNNVLNKKELDNFLILINASSFEDHIKINKSLDTFTAFMVITYKALPTILPLKLENFYDHILYTLPKTISLRGSTLYIDKPGIEIDLIKEYKLRENRYPKSFNLKDFSYKKTNKKIFTTLFNKINGELSDDEFKDLIDFENVENTTGQQDLLIFRLNNFVNDFNLFISHVIEENYPTKSILLKNKSFIIFKKTNSKDKENRSINKYILKINSFYM